MTTGENVIYQTKCQGSDSQLLDTWSFEISNYWLLGLLGIRSYWLCGQFALDKTVDNITDPNCTTKLSKISVDNISTNVVVYVMCRQWAYTRSTLCKGLAIRDKK